jgi:hypothetical protein
MCEAIGPGKPEPDPLNGPGKAYRTKKRKQDRYALVFFMLRLNYMNLSISNGQ